MERIRRKRIRRLGKVLFVGYVLFLVYFLLLSEIYGRTDTKMEYAYNLVLFKEITRFWQHRDVLGTYVVFINLAGNVLIFMPFGFIVTMSSEYKNLIRASAYSFLFSLCIESVQLVTKIGSFDVDDLLLNTIGGCVGCIIFILCCLIRRKYVAEETKKRK